MYTTTQPTTEKERPYVSLKTAVKDVDRYIWIERAQKWLRCQNNPVSKAYNEWCHDTDIVLNVPYLFDGVIVKFVTAGEAIN